MVDAKIILMVLGLHLVGPVQSVPSTSGIKVASGSEKIFSETWKTSNFLQCLQNKLPDFPNNITRSDELFECRNSVVKRAFGITSEIDDGIDVLETREIDAELDSDDLVGDMAKREPGSELQRRISFKNLVTNFQGAQVNCSEKNLPKYFEEAAPMRAKAHDLCMAAGSALMENEAFGKAKELKDAWTKSGLWLHNEQKALVYLALGLTPHGRTILAAAKIASSTLDDLCSSTLTMLSTKNEGCTKDIHFSEDFIFKSAQKTEVLDGFMDLHYKRDLIGFISTTFSRN